MIKILRLWAPVALWCVLIFYLSHQPHLRITEEWWDFYLRKVAHIGEYAVLSWLSARAFNGSTPWTSRQIIRYALGISVLYAASDEWHQHFVQGRVGSVADVGIDFLGILLGAWIWNKRKSSTGALDHV